MTKTRLFFEIFFEIDSSKAVLPAPIAPTISNEIMLCFLNISLFWVARFSLCSIKSSFNSITFDNPSSGISF